MGNFSFMFQKPGVYKNISFNAPTQNGFVQTNAFCPNELITGSNPFAAFMTPISGESELEFRNDCQNQINAACKSFKTDLWQAHIDGLNTVVNAHIQRCGRLIFNDLLIYVDCFAYLMKAHGYSESDIRYQYPRIVKQIVNQKLSYVKDQFTLQSISVTPIYREVLSKY